MTIKLSVLIPAYNLQDFIVDCLQSVLRQKTDFNFEVIVCDDASSDATAERIAELAKTSGQIKQASLKPIYKSTNAGLAANIETLLSAATGEYIAYMDGDDLALPGKLQQQVGYLDAHPDCQMVFHESEVFDSDSGATLKLYSQSFYNWQYISKRSGLEQLVRYGTYMQASSVMFRRHHQLLKSVPRGYNIILDYPFYMSNAGYLKAGIDFLPNSLGRYRLHAQSFGAQTQRNMQRREQCCMDMVKACRASAEFGLSQAIIDAGISQHYYAAALFFLFRQEDELFSRYIQFSAEQDSFFDERHRLAWQLHADPEQLRQQFRHQPESAANATGMTQ